MKRKSPPRTPSKAHSLVPFSGTHWGTVLVSAPVTQHFPHSTFSLPIAFAFPFCLQLSFAWGKWAVASQALKKKKKFPSTLQVVHHKPTVPLSETRHAIVCAPGPEFRFLHLIWTQDYFDIDSEKQPPLMFFSLWAQCIWNLSAACTKGRSVVDKQLLLPLTLSQGDVMQVEKQQKTVWSSWTWHSPSGKSTSFSRLTINKPLSSFLLSPSPSPVWELCTSVRKSSFHSLVQQDTTQPVSPGREGKCFISVENCLLLCHLNTSSIF